MKNLITILLIIFFVVVSLVFCLGQTRQKQALKANVENVVKDSLKRSITLSGYEKFKIEQFKNVVNEFQKEQQKYNDFLKDLFTANNIPLNKISLSPDSLKFSPDKIRFILKQ